MINNYFVMVMSFLSENWFVLANVLTLGISIAIVIGRTLSRITTKALTICGQEEIQVIKGIPDNCDNRQNFRSGTLIYFTTYRRKPGKKEIYINKRFLYSLINEINNAKVIIECDGCGNIQDGYAEASLKKLLKYFQKNLTPFERYVFDIYWGTFGAQ